MEEVEAQKQQAETELREARLALWVGASDVGGRFLPTKKRGQNRKKQTQKKVGL